MMVTNCDQNKFSDTEAKLEQELKELGDEFCAIPDEMLSIMDSNMDQETSFRSIEGDKLATNDPLTPIPTSFPVPPQFCSGM